MEKQSFREYHKGKPSDPTIKNIEQYLPFGEIEEKALIKGDSPTIWRQTLVDEHLNSYNSPYKFNGKELDEETGNYYYGARYYDPRISTFLSVDPLAEQTMSSYGYCSLNPVNRIDPNGKADIYAKSGKWIGSDGVDDGRIYIARGSLKREIRKNSKTGNLYKGRFNEGRKLVLVPSGKTREAVINSVDNTRKTQLEHGGHSTKNGIVAEWDAGTPARLEINDSKKTISAVASINGFNGVDRPQNDNIEIWWHTHPDTKFSGSHTFTDGTIGEYSINLGSSTPSGADKSFIRGMADNESNPYTGSTFVIGVGTNRVSYFDKKGSFLNLSYDKFLEIGTNNKQGKIYQQFNENRSE